MGATAIKKKKKKTKKIEPAESDTAEEGSVVMEGERRESGRGGGVGVGSS